LSYADWLYRKKKKNETYLLTKCNISIILIRFVISVIFFFFRNTYNICADSYCRQVRPDRLVSLRVYSARDNLPGLYDGCTDIHVVFSNENRQPILIFLNYYCSILIIFRLLWTCIYEFCIALLVVFVKQNYIVLLKVEYLCKLLPQYSAGKDSPYREKATTETTIYIHVFQDHFIRIKYRITKLFTVHFPSSVNIYIATKYMLM
jgi:hypothetical protein